MEEKDLFMLEFKSGFVIIEIDGIREDDMQDLTMQTEIEGYVVDSNCRFKVGEFIRFGIEILKMPNIVDDDNYAVKSFKDSGILNMAHQDTVTSYSWFDRLLKRDRK